MLLDMKFGIQLAKSAAKLGGVLPNPKAVARMIMGHEVFVATTTDHFPLSVPSNVTVLLNAKNIQQNFQLTDVKSNTLTQSTSRRRKRLNGLKDVKSLSQEETAKVEQLLGIGDSLEDVTQISLELLQLIIEMRSEATPLVVVDRHLIKASWLQLLMPHLEIRDVHIDKSALDNIDALVSPFFLPVKTVSSMSAMPKYLEGKVVHIPHVSLKREAVKRGAFRVYVVDNAYLCELCSVRLATNQELIVRLHHTEILHLNELFSNGPENAAEAMNVLASVSDPVLPLHQQFVDNKEYLRLRIIRPIQWIGPDLKGYHTLKLWHTEINSNKVSSSDLKIIAPKGSFKSIVSKSLAALSMPDKFVITPVDSDLFGRTLSCCFPSMRIKSLLAMPSDLFRARYLEFLSDKTSAVLDEIVEASLSIFESDTANWFSDNHVDVQHISSWHPKVYFSYLDDVRDCYFRLIRFALPIFAQHLHQMRKANEVYLFELHTDDEAAQVGPGNKILTLISPFATAGAVVGRNRLDGQYNVELFLHNLWKSNISWMIPSIRVADVVDFCQQGF